MDDQLSEMLDSYTNKNCQYCGEYMSIELYLCHSPKDEYLYVWEEGLCNNCGNGFFDPFLKAVLVVDEASLRALAN